MKEDRKKKRIWHRRTAAILAAGLIFLGWQKISPAVGWLLSQAALFTTILDMPEGTLELLRAHYGGQEYREEAPQEPPVLPPEEPDPPEKPEIPVPEVEEEFRGTVSELHFEGEDTPAYAKWEDAWIRNYTDLTREEIAKALSKPSGVRIEGKKEPEVLIFHTHATESFEPWDRETFDIRNTWRDADNEKNMVAVGDVLTEGLEKAGVAVCHNNTQHDNPSYTGAYERSRETIRGYQKKHPTLKVLLDLHRDAIVYNEKAIAKTVAVIEGKKAAQLMIIAPYDDGTIGVPRWKENFRFAVELTDRIEKVYPGLCRPVFFCSRTYNYALADGSLLFEIGTNGNTLEEAKYTAELVAPILAEYLTRP